jgi:hypothetical protein
MQLLNKARTLRTLGGVVAALAIVPWLGVGMAQAVGGGDDSCATRPSGVSGDATCSLLLGPNGSKVFGETWAVRTSDNHLVVWTFPDQNVPSGGVSLCVRSSSAYPAKHQCNGSDADSAYSGSSTTVDVSLKSAGISGDAPVHWALGVEQGSSVAVSLGSADALPGSTPSPSPTHTSTTSPSPSHTHKPSPSPSHTHSPSPSPSPSQSHTHSPSPSPSPSHTHTHSPSPSPSVSATTTHTDGTTPSPSTSVLGTKLAHTGNDDVAGALVLSLSLLALGGILVVGAQTVPAAARRRH